RKILLGRPRPPLVNRFFEELIEPIKAFRPDLIGFSILFSQQLFFALALAKLCKVTGAKIVFGGATFSVMPDPGRLLSGPLAIYPGGELREVDTGRLIDYLIVGEGERGLESLAKSLSAGRGKDASDSAFCPLCRVPGLLHMEDGKAARNPAEAASDLNALPLPDFS